MSSQVNIHIDAGTDFTLTAELFNEANFDLSIENYEFFGNIRKLYSTKLVAEFEFEKSDNNITLLLSSSVTAQLVPGKYQYDVLMRKSTGELTKIINGLAFVIPTITHVV